MLFQRPNTLVGELLVVMSLCLLLCVWGSYMEAMLCHTSVALQGRLQPATIDSKSILKHHLSERNHSNNVTRRLHHMLSRQRIVEDINPGNAFKCLRHCPRGYYIRTIALPKRHKTRQISITAPGGSHLRRNGKWLLPTSPSSCALHDQATYHASNQRNTTQDGDADQPFLRNLIVDQGPEAPCLQVLRFMFKQEVIVSSRFAIVA